ncbi:hypothetical protein EPUS_05723 [Endocarpon pusillum Z07020]|uniref:Uncharacterized protein n=1 Tax=Endocarpon pusillum (strain Z07020 / HMAS-L-300199) TaxID=1263415 RepID=U1FV42_ENDPU|nr:uncharacterized protein EPUS_05723 [Endocarpon pusillum Z07020]ERF68662.1 hypothetical protein EPUS_05723 [Endocarpon pusillum Z07020]
MSTPPVLTSQQKVTAKRVAKPVLGTPAPVWSEMGEDDKETKLRLFMERLRETQNTSIADKLEEDVPLAYKILQEKAKSMRSEERKKAL